MHTYITFILRYRFAVLAGVLIVTTAFGAVASHGVYSSAIAKLFFGEKHPGFLRYRDRIREFANDEVVIVIYKDAQVFSAASLARLEEVVEKIERLPEIRRVDSLLNAQYIFREADTLYVEHYVDEALESPPRAERALHALTHDAMYRNLLISADGRHAAVMIELEPIDELAGETIPPLINTIMGVFAQAGFQPDTLRRVGFTSSTADVVSQTDFNIKRLFPLGCVVLLVIVFLMFQRFWPVVITLGVALIGVVWTFGFAVLLDRQISIFISMAPLMIMIVATSDIIHLCNAYLLELSRELSKDEALVVSGAEVGNACFWTSATTFVGFVSLSFVPAPMIRKMGLVLGFGVAASLLLALTLTPILLSLLKQPEPHTYDASPAQRLLGRVLLKIEQYVVRRPRSVVAMFTLVFALSLYGSTRINIDTDFYKRFSPASRTRRDEVYYQQHFAGANFLEIFLDTPEAGGILDPALFTKTTAFQRAVEQLPEVDAVLSLVNLVETIDREMNPAYTPEQPTTWTQPLLAQYLLLFEFSGGQDLDRLVDFERKTLRLNVRLAENGTQFTYATGQTIQRLADEIFGEAAEVEVTGMMYLLGGFVDDVIRGQQRGLGFAFIMIMSMMMFMFRSLKIGLWSMFPNILPLLALGGYLGFFWRVVDSDTIVIAMVAIGIGVDDTIHFLSRLRFESARASAPDLALQRTFHFSGRAMVMTTLILSAGFLPLGLSDYFSVRIFGTLLPMTLIAAVLADILLVPALVKLGFMRFPSGGT
jgi:uncharacterized protein